MILVFFFILYSLCHTLLDVFLYLCCRKMKSAGPTGTIAMDAPLLPTNEPTDRASGKEVNPAEAILFLRPTSQLMAQTTTTSPSPTAVGCEDRSWYHDRFLSACRSQSGNNPRRMMCVASEECCTANFSNTHCCFVYHERVEDGISNSALGHADAVTITPDKQTNVCPMNASRHHPLIPSLL